MTASDADPLIVDGARRFFDVNAPLTQHRCLRRGTPSGYDAATWRGFAEMGWLAMPWEEAYDGLDLGFSALGLVAKESGRTLVCSPFIETVWICGTVIARSGTSEQKAELLPAIASGARILALALDEGERHDPGTRRTVAHPWNGGYRLTGQKTFVCSGMAADEFLCVAGLAFGAEEGLGLFRIPADTPGVTRRPLVTLSPSGAAAVNFDEIYLPSTALIGGEGAQMDVIHQGLDHGRVGLAAEMLGAAEAIFSRTVDYVKEREQFGRKIGSFQSIRHRCADLYCRLQLSQAVLADALAALDAPDRTGDVALAASHAKSLIGETAARVTREAIQMHGGIGMTDEYDAGLFLKALQVAERRYGDRTFHLNRYAEMVDRAE